MTGLFDEKENCCGCTACFATCIKKAIKMEVDEEGFLYPKVDKDKCINCLNCESVCAFNADQKMAKYKEGKFISPITFAVKHKDLGTRMNSRSGGIFTALSDYYLEKDGLVYGCVLDSSFTAVHFRAGSKEERNRMRGSKYVQSYIGEIFTAVKKDLEEGKEVLFSGTSCQIAGLMGFLKKEYLNLLTVDIVCHGVPSPKVWKDYLNWQEKKRHGKIKRVEFRNKKDFGWRDHVETLYFENGRRVDSKVYTTLFYGNSLIRPSCYECPYKGIVHPGDITIADYWGIEKAAPGFDDNKGISLVLINDEKGRDAFETICDRVSFVETQLKDSMQKPLIAPFPMPENRSKVWEEYSTNSFSYIARKYGGDNLLSKMKIIKKRLQQRKKKKEY